VLRCSFYKVDEGKVKTVVRGSVEVKRGVRTLDSFFK
jgi:hypothetical protein